MSRKHELINLLRTEWAEIDELLTELPTAAWRLTTLPGWNVQDTVAHIIGTEKMLAGQSAPPSAPAPADSVGVAQRSHVLNPIGEANEAWVESMRPWTPEEMIENFQKTAAERLSALEAMSDEAFNAPSWTPAGQGTFASFMRIRVFDCWMHEQDIREAVGRPGNEDGAVAEEALAEVVGALGYIVGKRGGAPNGSSVTIQLTGPLFRRLHVLVDGKAKVVDHLEHPATATVAMSSMLFMRLTGGRIDPSFVSDQIGLGGDIELAERVATHLAFTI